MCGTTLNVLVGLHIFSQGFNYNSYDYFLLDSERRRRRPETDHTDMGYSGFGFLPKRRRRRVSTTCFGLEVLGSGWEGRLFWGYTEGVETPRTILLMSFLVSLSSVPCLRLMKVFAQEKTF